MQDFILNISITLWGFILSDILQDLILTKKNICITFLFI